MTPKQWFERWKGLVLENLLVTPGLVYGNCYHLCRPKEDTMSP